MGIESVVNIDIFNENRPRNINFVHLKKKNKNKDCLHEDSDSVGENLFICPIKYKLEVVSIRFGYNQPFPLNHLSFTNIRYRF